MVLHPRGDLPLHLGIITAYKRMGWVMVAMMPILYLLAKRGLFEQLVYVGTGILAVVVIFLVFNNNFYSMSLEDAIWHKEDLGNFSFFNGTEIFDGALLPVGSGQNMVEALSTGSGPGTFYPVYQHYTDNAFRTYVSDNPEQSTCHNYYLQTFAEQDSGRNLVSISIYSCRLGSHLPCDRRSPSQISIMMVMLNLLAIEAFIFSTS